MKKNYQQQLDHLIDGLAVEGDRPRLLLHACCAPCSSYVLEYLSQYFDITVLFYNPNIFPASEYDFRSKELARLIGEMRLSDRVRLVMGRYEPHEFTDMAKGLELLPEGGDRCRRCYALRLSESARIAAEGGYDYYTTTLSISPHKNAEWINEIGEEMGALYGVKHLPSDFKKKNGYKRSCALSEEYGLYRQDYCGCVFSRHEAETRKKNS